eukprot:scaffold1248_cov393-Prasinococcus_capsulatus_cf.AAC.28
MCRTLTLRARQTEATAAAIIQEARAQAGTSESRDKKDSHLNCHICGDTARWSTCTCFQLKTCLMHHRHSSANIITLLILLREWLVGRN